MFDQIQERLNSIFRNLSKKGKISESNISDALRDVRRAMLEADVNFKVVKKYECANLAEVLLDYVVDENSISSKRFKNIFSNII